jgi:YidC/Oxa1 family membrane protein insertase
VSGIIDAVIGFFGGVLAFLHDLVAQVGFLEGAAWGWAIILLTLIVRIALLPLAIKQTRSMRAMTALQPQIKALQKKYKVDRDLMRKDPEQYRVKRQKLQEEQMALFQREGVNPMASCLPLLAQAPVFLALFWTLNRYDQNPRTADLAGSEFYFFTAVGDGGLEMLVSQAGWPGWLLIVLMSGTMFFAQKQMMARNAASMADNPMAQQQKILLYVMPLFLAVISFQFPIGILLYWVTTNFWQVAQQWIILREVQHEAETGELAERPGGEAAKRNPSEGSGKGKKQRQAGGPAGKNGSTDKRPVKGGDQRRSKGASSGKKPVEEPSATEAPPSTNGSSPSGGGDEVPPTNGATPTSGGGAQDDRQPDASATPRSRSTGREHLPRRRGRGSNDPGGQA